MDFGFVDFLLWLGLFWASCALFFVKLSSGQRLVRTESRAFLSHFCGFLFYAAVAAFSAFAVSQCQLFLPLSSAFGLLFLDLHSPSELVSVEKPNMCPSEQTSKFESRKLATRDHWTAGLITSVVEIR